MRQVGRAEHALDHHVGVAEEARQRSDLPGQGGAAGFHRGPLPHLHGQEHVVGAGVRAHVVEQGFVRGAAGRGRDRRSRLGQEGADSPPVVGEGGGEPLQAVHRRPVTGGRRQHRGPRPDPPVLLVGAEQREAAAPQRQRGRQGPRRAVVHHAHVLPLHLEQAQTAQRAQGTRPRPAATARLEADRDRHPLVPGAAGHRHGGQCAVEHEDAQGGRHPGDVRLPAQHQHAEDEADGDGEDLAGAPAGERAAAFARPEAVAHARLGRHGSSFPASGWPGGQAGGNDRTTGPWSSMSR